MQRIVTGNCLETLPTLPAGSVHCVVTSPPYFALRSYLPKDHPDKAKEIGSEATPEAFVQTMVEVFRAVRRVLRDDGVMFVNLGDSYSGSGKGGGGNETRPRDQNRMANPHRKPIEGADGSQLLMPHRVAMALQADGWILRSTIVWAKPSPMPESISGWRWKRCKIKTGGGERGREAYRCGANGSKPQQDHNGKYFAASAQWSDCPGCARCSPHGGYVLRRGKWRCTTSHEYLFQFSKAPWIGPAPGRYDRISDEDARWLALLIDAEGNILVRKAIAADGHTQYAAQVAIGNTSEALMKRVCEIIGDVQYRQRQGKNAPMYYVQMTAQKARDLLHRLYHFFIIKQRQARVAIYVQDILKSPKKRPGGYRHPDLEATLQDAWAATKSLNHFGDPDISWASEPEFGRWGKSEYFCDGDACQERGANTCTGRTRGGKHGGATVGEVRSNGSFRAESLTQTRNPRSVWTISSEPFKGSHFATFPGELARRCIVAGTSAKGCCPACGSQWAPVVESERVATRVPQESKLPGYMTGERVDSYGRDRTSDAEVGRRDPQRHIAVTSIKSYRPTCDCPAHEPRPCVVLDPFGGSGTVGQVAKYSGRDSILCELNPEYIPLIEKRSATPWNPPKTKKPAKKRTRKCHIQKELFP